MMDKADETSLGFESQFEKVLSAVMKHDWSNLSNTGEILMYLLSLHSR